jgi:hypothetical protein
VSETLADQFLDNKSYSPWTRRLIADSLSKLRGVSGIGNFLSAALRADDEPAALYFVAASEMLQARHGVQKFERLVSSVCLPAGVDKGGLLYVPLPVDHLVWTKQVATIFRDLKARVSKERNIIAAELVVRGSVSARAMEKLTKGGAKVVTIR